ncbi:MAG: hypothetical protein WC428_08495 [Candidatus Paceibacterota bacterium]
MDLKNIETWDQMAMELDRQYIILAKNGIQSREAIADPETFKKIQIGIFNTFCPNETPDPNATSIDLIFPAGPVALIKGQPNKEPYILFIGGKI